MFCTITVVHSGITDNDDGIIETSSVFKSVHLIYRTTLVSTQLQLGYICYYQTMTELSETKSIGETREFLHMFTAGTKIFKNETVEEIGLMFRLLDADRTAQ